MRVPLNVILIFLFIILSSTLNIMAQEDITRRQKYLEEVINISNLKVNKKAYNAAITVKDSSWVDWQKRTGELPPDFEKMVSTPFLPEPLVLNKDGKEIALLNSKISELLKSLNKYSEILTIVTFCTTNSIFVSLSFYGSIHKTEFFVPYSFCSQRLLAGSVIHLPSIMNL